MPNFDSKSAYYNQKYEIALNIKIKIKENKILLDYASENIALCSFESCSIPLENFK